MSMQAERREEFDRGAAVAARAIRRGRHLTASEQVENLAAAFEAEGDPEIAAKIRRAK